MKWEYQVYLLPSIDEARDVLEEMGEEGWELVSANIEPHGYDCFYHLFLKRLKKEDYYEGETK